MCPCDVHWVFERVVCCCGYVVLYRVLLCIACCSVSHVVMYRMLLCIECCYVLSAVILRVALYHVLLCITCCYVSSCVARCYVSRIVCVLLVCVLCRHILLKNPTGGVLLIDIVSPSPSPPTNKKVCMSIVVL